MIAENFKFVFSCPEYKMSVKKINVVFNYKTNYFDLNSFDVEEKFIKFGNILNPTKNIAFYEVTFIGENNYKFARKYFLKLFKRESPHSTLYEARYLKYKTQVEKEIKNESL